ncbi:MAG: 30S ribosomal protein S6 [Patescibacteria group bacterium]
MNYELTVMLKPDLSPEKSKKSGGEIQEAVEKLGGKTANLESLGMKSLAYPIQGSGQASFARLQLELDPAKVQDLRRQLERQEGVMRVLIIKGGAK